ncbi:MAG: glycosyltransferase family 39 protein [Chloroflexi bacterium]|nr:glycosyltransferase family 39 protein [Chloroflexota bacterium]
MSTRQPPDSYRRDAEAAERPNPILSLAPFRPSPLAPLLLFSSLVLLVCVVFVTYSPGLRMGFYLDDYVYLERAGHTTWASALAQIFDPRLQTQWYRPLQAIQFFLEYNLFGGNSNAYHLINMGFHAVNVLFLYGLAWRISRRWIIGLLSALFYASFSVYASGINWIGIVDPLTAVFYLATIWFWWTYLEKQDWIHYALAFAAFVLALLAKQIAITLPVVLFLAEWWLMSHPLSIPHAVRRYAPFFVGAAIYAAVQAMTQSTHTFAAVFGWQVGASMAFILVQYLVLLFFPWGTFPSIDINQVEAGDVRLYAWLVIALLVFLYILRRKKSRVLLFLSVFTLLNLVLVLPFPFIEHRYLYIPILSAAVILALIFDAVQWRLRKPAWWVAGSSAGLALLLLWSGVSVNASALDAAEWARQLRVPFRDIERQHATYPKDTRLYFIDPITPTTGGLSGMFLLRYGPDISVGNWTEYAGLREHNAAYVYYFDKARRPQEIPVDKGAVTQSSLPLPVTYNAPISLEGYEVAETSVQRGHPLLLILYWRGHAPIDRNYTVFVHLLDANGQAVAGYDSEPRKAKDPTSSWVPTLLQSDPILLPIGNGVPVGTGYKLEVGLYYLPTLQRLSIVGKGGAPLTDAITISSFTVTP